MAHGHSYKHGFEYSTPIKEKKKNELTTKKQRHHHPAKKHKNNTRIPTIKFSPKLLPAHLPYSSPYSIEKRRKMSFQDLEYGRPLAGRRDQTNASQAVAAGVFQISTAVRNFERLVNSIGTPKDTPDLREKLHNLRLQIGQLVKDTSAKLKQASDTDHRAEVSASKKIADAKLAKDFENILKEFQKYQRLAAERETAFAPLAPQAAFSSSYNSVAVDNDRAPEQRALLAENRRQEVLLLDNEIVFNEAIIEEREQGILEVQNQIGEVNEIFKDLAVLVNDQGVVIDDINSHIENSYAATAQANSQLKKAAKSQKSNSSLACLLLVIFGIILLIVIIVVAA